MDTAKDAKGSSKPSLHPAGLRIRLFGPLALAWGQEPLPTPRSSTTRSLLAYLIWRHGRMLSRDLLLGSFWPERPEPAARKALSNALWQVRRTLGPAAGRLAVERDTVTFALQPDDWLDVAAFEQYLHRSQGTLPNEAPLAQALSKRLSDLGAAVTLYTAGFFEGNSDDWVLSERERLREQYLWALDQLITLHKQWGNYEQALAYSQQMAAADPLRESAHRELMRLYHLLGHDRAALEQYQALRRRLQEELGVEPTAATTALYRELTTAAGPSGPAHLQGTFPPLTLADLSHLPFVGRVRERAALLEPLHAAAQGHGAMALVEGMAGVGKTRLVREVIAEAQWRGFHVGLGRADPLAASAPYQPLHDALSSLLTPQRIAQLAELVEPLWLSASAALLPELSRHLPELPPLPPLEPQQEQQRLGEGLSRCLAALSAMTPLLLVLEDMHWADAATLAALSCLPPGLPAERVLIILTCRSAEARTRSLVWETLESLDRFRTLLRIELAPLAPEESNALILRALAGATGPQSGALIQSLQERSGGNPLFLIETLKTLLEQEILAPRPGGGWNYPDGEFSLPTPASIQELVGQRLIRLPAALRSTLELTAVLGEEAGFTLLSRISAAPPAALANSMDTLCRQGFLSETGAGYRFEHDLVRETTYQAIPHQRLRTLHRRAGEALESLHPERIETLAHHAAAGAEWARAAHYYQAAGDRAAAAGANPNAAVAYTHAVEALESLGDQASPGQRFALLLAREKVYDVLGRRESQEQDLTALGELAQALGEPQRQAEVALRRANYAKTICDYPRAIAEAEITIETTQAALEAAPGGELARLQAQAYHSWGEALWLQGDPEAAQEHLKRALTLAQNAHLRRVEADCIAMLGIISYYQSEYPEAQAHLKTALPILQELEDLPGQGRVLNSLALVHHDLGDYTAAMPYYKKALSIHRQTGDRKGEGMVLNNLGLAAHDQGALTEAQDFYQQALSIFRQVGDRRGESMALNNSGRALSDQGCYTQAKGYYEQALQIRREIGHRQGEGVVLSNLGLVQHRLGDDETAQQLLQQALQIAKELDDRDTAGYSLTYLGHVYTARGRPKKAAAAYQQALEIRLEMGLYNPAIESRAGLAHACLLRKDLEQARRHALEILEALERCKQEGVEDLFWVYLVCYRVLHAVQDPRAEGILNAAYHSLQERASRIHDKDLRRSFLENVASHREITAAHEAIQPMYQPIRVRLPHIDAPTGRPLRDDEYVEVFWTVTHPEDGAIPGKIQRRRHCLQRLIGEAADQGTAPTVDDLADALQVTPRTIKRDLAALRAAGQPTPTRGQREQD